MATPQRPALLIMGPTASGKSALALTLAERLDGEIVNADSMQMYRDLRILTARPTPDEEAAATHHLYGCIDAAIRYSAGAWLSEALPVIAAIKARGRMPIVVGGTGLYFRALTFGLVDIPAADAETRERLGARLRDEGAQALHAALMASDPETAARLSPHDAPRILRALEVLETTGVSISQFQSATQPPLAPSDWTGMALTPDRADLYRVIDRRFEAMLEADALEEVRALASRRLDPMLPAMKAHGAPALMAHLRGELSLEAAAELGKRDTRRYAKRQFTWMAGQMPGWTRVAEPGLAARTEAAEKLLAEPR